MRLFNLESRWHNKTLVTGTHAKKSDGEISPTVISVNAINRRLATLDPWSSEKVTFEKLSRMFLRESTWSSLLTQGEIDNQDAGWGLILKTKEFELSSRESIQHFANNTVARFSLKSTQSLEVFESFVSSLFGTRKTEVF